MPGKCGLGQEDFRSADANRGERCPRVATWTGESGDGGGRRVDTGASSEATGRHAAGTGRALGRISGHAFEYDADLVGLAPVAAAA